MKLETLRMNSEKDYDKNDYNLYEYYLSEYNRILTTLQSEYFNDLLPIEILSDDRKAKYGPPGTTSEVAKHKEVVYRTIDLLKKVSAINNSNNIETKSNEEDLVNILSSFHKVARQLRSRHNNRNTIEIEDEYDVQDLLHALLRLHFDDVRPEEWTPSYAGGSKRMDFLLKDENIVIEVKKTRIGLADKAVGEQLIVDIECYKNHPNCERLICFVYDPEGRIGNPVGIENDLVQQSRDNLEVKVYIFPK